MEENARIVERLYEALEADDMDAAVALCSPEVEWHYPAFGALSYGGQWTGRDGILRWADAHDEAEEILDFRVEDLVAAGDHVFAVGYFRGRARPDGDTWETRFVHALTIRDGQVIRFEAFFDTAAAVDAHRKPVSE